MAVTEILDVPTLHPRAIRIKNRLVGTIVARHLEFPHFPRPKYRVRMPGGETIEFLSTSSAEQPDNLDIGEHVTLDVLPLMPCSALPAGSAISKKTMAGSNRPRGSARIRVTCGGEDTRTLLDAHEFTENLLAQSSAMRLGSGHGAYTP
jgi:hypothetical protein